MSLHAVFYRGGWGSKIWSSASGLFHVISYCEAYTQIRPKWHFFFEWRRVNNVSFIFCTCKWNTRVLAIFRIMFVVQNTSFRCFAPFGSSGQCCLEPPSVSTILELCPAMSITETLSTTSSDDRRMDTVFGPWSSSCVQSVRDLCLGSVRRGLHGQLHRQPGCVHDHEAGLRPHIGRRRSAGNIPAANISFWRDLGSVLRWNLKKNHVQF